VDTIITFQHVCLLLKEGQSLFVQAETLKRNLVLKNYKLALESLIVNYFNFDLTTFCYDQNRSNAPSRNLRKNLFIL
jgi:hypothetical protein